MHALDKQELEDLLFILQKKHVNSKLLPIITRDWPIIKEGCGRQEFSPKINEIDEIQAELTKLHPIAVMEFLKFYGECNPKRSYLPAIWKGKAILFRLLSGRSSHDIPLTSYPTFRRIEEEFWENNKDKINQWCKKWLSCLSDAKIRALYARINNPNPFKVVTLFVDGKDFVITLNELRVERKKTKNGKSTLLSRKNGFKNAGKLIFVDDIDLYPVAISKVVGANEMYDGHLFRDMKIYKKIDPDLDHFMFDNHFVSVIDDIIEESEREGVPLNRNHFSYAVRKKPGVSLQEDEEDYNTKFGQFRSKHESMRMTLGSTFKGLTKGRKSNFETLYLQINVCVILSSISRKCFELPELFNCVDAASNDPSFNFPTHEIEETSQSLIELHSCRNEMEKRQEAALLKLKRNILRESHADISSDDDDDETEELVSYPSDEDENDEEVDLEGEMEETLPFRNILREIAKEMNFNKRIRRKSSRYLEFKRKVTRQKRLSAIKRRNQKKIQ